MEIYILDQWFSNFLHSRPISQICDTRATHLPPECLVTLSWEGTKRKRGKILNFEPWAQHAYVFPDLRYFLSNTPTFPWLEVFFTQFPDFSLTLIFLFQLVPCLFSDLRYFAPSSPTFPWPEVFFNQFLDFSLTWFIFHWIPQLFPGLEFIELNFSTFPCLEVCFTQFHYYSLTWCIFYSSLTLPWTDVFFTQNLDFTLTSWGIFH